MSCDKMLFGLEQNTNWVRALSVPMYLGLKTCPLCPMLRYKVTEALVLYSSSDCPHIQTPKVIWIQNGVHIK